LVKLSDDLIQTIIQTTQQIMPQRKDPSPHAKHWWNQDLSKTSEELRKLSGIIKTSRNPYLIRQHKRTKKVFRAKVHHAKQNWATTRLEGATSSTVWNFIKWYKHTGKRHRPLYSTPSNVPAPDDETRANIFAKEFFPNPHPNKNFSPSDEPSPTR
jgi:hypothetical protein